MPMLLLAIFALSPFFFFFYVYAAHRDLHSFPTRRSSDLRRAVHCRHGHHSPGVQAALEGRLLMAATHANGRPARILWRSEEHTSELQSHSDLVCRLLLEKKKKKKKNKCQDTKQHDNHKLT